MRTKEKSGAAAALYSLRSITYEQRIGERGPMRLRQYAVFVTNNRTNPERDVTLQPNQNSNFQRVLTASYEGGSLRLLQSRSRPAKRERRRGLTPSAGNG